MEIWNDVILKYFGEALLFLSTLTRDIGGFGTAIILFTLIVKVLTVPLNVKQFKSTRKMQALQPQLQALQKKYAKDREKLTQEQMRLYKENDANPMSGCLPSLIQMPIWFAMYGVLNNMRTSEVFQQGFLWLPSLALPNTFPDFTKLEAVAAAWPYMILPVLTGVSQWVVQKMMQTPSADPQQNSMQNIMQFMPVMFIFVGLSFPSALSLYWVASNLSTLAQQYLMMKLIPTPVCKPLPALATATASAGATTPEPSRNAAPTAVPGVPRKRGFLDGMREQLSQSMSQAQEQAQARQAAPAAKPGPSAGGAPGIPRKTTSGPAARRGNRKR